MGRAGTSQLRCSPRSTAFTFLQFRAAYSTPMAPSSRMEAPEKSPSGSSDADKSSFQVGAALHEIVEHARSPRRPPLPPLDSPIKPNFSLTFSQWLTYTQKVVPSASQEEKLAYSRLQHAVYVKKIIGNLNSRHDVHEGISRKRDLSVQDVLQILTKLESKALGFDFYQWLRLQRFYVADRSIYLAVIGCIIDCPSSEIVWHHLQEVMKHMIWRKMYLDDCMFVEILRWGQPGNKDEPYSVARVECYVKWFVDMRAAGFQPDSSAFENLMQICNRAGLYGSTLSLFKDIRMNNHLWAYALALSACRGMNNLELAETYWKEMKLLGLKPDAECFTSLLSLYGDQGDADKAESLFKEMQDEGVTPGWLGYSSLLKVCVSLGRMKQAEDVFKHAWQRGVRLNPAMYRGMSDC